MEMVDSSNIESVGYDSDARELHVSFVSGKTYVYSDVDDWVFHELLASESKGSYLNREIRNRYQFEER